MSTNLSPAFGQLGISHRISISQVKHSCNGCNVLMCWSIHPHPALCPVRSLHQCRISDLMAVEWERSHQPRTANRTPIMVNSPEPGSLISKSQVFHTCSMIFHDFGHTSCAFQPTILVLNWQKGGSIVEQEIQIQRRLWHLWPGPGKTCTGKFLSLS